MKKRIRQWLAVATALICSAAGAETLTQAWALALQKDHALAAARLQTQAAELDISAARSMRLPTLTANGSFMQFADAPAFDFTPAGIAVQLPEVIDNDNMVIGSMIVSLPVYTGGRITSAIGAANEARLARAANEAQAVQDTKLAVARAYVDVLRTQRALEVADSNVASLRSYAEEVQSLFDREIVPRNDLLASRVALANALQNRIRSANAVSVALAGYNRRLGQSLTRSVELDSSLPLLATQLDQPIEQLIERALNQRSEISALAAQAKATAHLANVERARLRPQVMLSGGYSYLENQAFDREEFASASIGFSWPLFDGGATHSRSAALQRRQRSLRELRADAESSVGLEVRQVWLELQEARSRVDVTAEAVAQSEENLRVTRRQYQAGLVISTRVLEAESLRTLSRSNHNDAVLDASLATYRLARALGEL